MNLFKADSRIELLPHDGEAVYFGTVFSAAQSVHYYNELESNIAWQHDRVKLFGREIVTKRKVAWYGDRAFSYTYSNATKRALAWTPALKELKAEAERLAEASFNACLLNLYHNGSEGMAWHSDGEKELVQNAAIASISFGAARKFAFKHRESGLKKTVILEPGSLLVMKGDTQKHWQHRLPPTKLVHTPRINLTFRLMNG